MNYVVRNQSEEDRAAFIKPFQDALKTPQGGKPLEENVERRREIFSMILTQVKGYGEGSEKGGLSVTCILVMVAEIVNPQKSRGFSTSSIPTCSLCIQQALLKKNNT